MKKLLVYILLGLCLGLLSCHTQNVTTTNKENKQKGVLIYSMHEPYFFPIVDTSIVNIAKSNLIGIKLGKIEFNDIYDSISHKHSVLIYATGDKNRIDTVKSEVGVLPVKMETKLTKTELTPDSAAFNFEYGPNEWGLFKYEIRFDKEVLSITPLFLADKNAFKAYIKGIQSN